MAYRSIKRVLGETSLERKCRLLFGTCLLLLISGAFIWVDQIAESLVKENQEQALSTLRQRCRGLAQMRLLAMHFERWAETTRDDESDLPATQETPFEVQQLANELIDEDSQWEILTLKQEHPRQALGEERDILLQLMDELRSWEERHQEAEAMAMQTLPEPPFADRRPANTKDYVFYQPVIWQPFCTNFCHPTLGDFAAMPGSSTGLPPADTERLFAVKITMETPYSESKAAIHWIRAILSAAGITTFFVAMVALYVIVRYVIVKPLSHLRDVSEAIRSGKTELRAEIHTNDEFEELAHSFNRMLRHLTETQVDLRNVNRDLDAKVDELAQLNMRLYEMNRLKSDFLASVSHELRTPLNSIIGFSEVLQGLDSLTDKQKRYARNIQKSGRVLLEMINDILDLAKIDAGKMDVKLTEFNIHSLVHAQCDIMRTLSGEKNIELRVDVPRDLPSLFQDQSKVQQILTNLLSNAIKFTPEGGRVAVRATRDGDGKLVLTVEDSGVGIPEEDSEVIFEKFRQSRSISGADGLTREYSGTGLGLSIVKELCILLQGEIDFESELGHGSTFRVKLPWALDASAPDRFDYGSGAADGESTDGEQFSSLAPTPSPNS